MKTSLYTRAVTNPMIAGAVVAAASAAAIALVGKNRKKTDSKPKPVDVVEVVEVVEVIGIVEPATGQPGNNRAGRATPPPPDVMM